MNLDTNLQMAGESPEDQARRAIVHTLEQIRANPSGLGWYAGVGSQTFALLTEAAAALFKRPVEEVRETFAPVGGHDPQG